MFQERLGMVSLWMDNGNLQEYLRKVPGVDRYELVCIDTVIKLGILAVLIYKQCIQVASGVSYLHSIDMVWLICFFNVITEDNLRLSDTW